MKGASGPLGSILSVFESSIIYFAGCQLGISLLSLEPVRTAKNHAVYLVYKIYAPNKSASVTFIKL